MKPIVKRTPPGMALVITLTMLVLATIVVMGMITMVRLERVSARNTFEDARANALCDAAADHALALIRDTITAAEATTTNSAPDTRKFWASQPGKITVFNSNGTVDTASSKGLYSTGTAPNAPVVDLNAMQFGGTYPIVADDGSGSPPEMEVAWVNVLKDPSQAAAKNNPVIGRYAFWVDDESTKLNISTADGSVKSGTNSFGPGTPAEMNLQALTNGSATSLTATQAAAIAQQSGAQHLPGASSNPFNSTREVLKVPGINEALHNIHSQDLTNFNTAPELNLFGEPRIYLTTAAPALFSTDKIKAESTPLTLLTGPYAAIDPHPSTSLPQGDLAPRIVATAQPLTWLYPSSAQLPRYRYTSYGNSTDTTVPLPQFFRDDLWPWVTSVLSSQNHPAKGYPGHSVDYEMGMRIARYLKGWNSQGNPLAWPAFEGSDPEGFSGKYTDRQIDDMAVQLLSLLKQTHIDHYYNYTLPYYIPTGFLSGKPVRGSSRAPRVTEVLMIVSTYAGDPPLMKIKFVTEFYLPKQFGGSDLTFGQINLWAIRNNFKDWPTYNSKTAQTVTGPAPLGGYWADSMLQITDQNGNLAGVDLFGNPGNKPDPNQEKAALYHHPWALKNPNNPHDPVNNPYMGVGPAPSYDVWGYPAFNFDHSLPGSPQAFKTWMLGDYLAAASTNSSLARPMKSGITSITIGGGLTVWLMNSSNQLVEAVPIGSIFPNTATLTEDERQVFREAVIPIQGTVEERTIQIPGTKVFHLQVADPLVNAFPGDWSGTVLPDTSSSEITMPPTVYNGNTASLYYQDGLNTISKLDRGSDPESVWWPEQNPSIPKSRRFPSTGYLQYIRTGVMPDPEDDNKSPREQKGTPWRMLNFSPSTAASQQTLGGKSFPDWLLLDLFTTPAVFQPLGNPLPSPIIRTWGGATAGRLNPNAILVPFGFARTKPLEALFKDIQASTEYDSSGELVQTTVDEVALSNAVISYIKGLGRPLMMTGEICNVPEMADYLYKEVDAAAQSRNDLLRQTIGNLTTRSNTFTVWTAGDVIQKKPGNTNYGVFENGDIVLGRSRMRYVIERYLDPGTDGVYGNTTNPGTDGVVNTPDDPTTGTTGAHPAMTYPLPYKYRITSISRVE